MTGACATLATILRLAIRRTSWQPSHCARRQPAVRKAAQLRRMLATAQLSLHAPLARPELALLHVMHACQNLRSR
jgi:hypothetical protein